MKYCTGCSSEYQDTVTECADCGGTELVAGDEMKSRGLLLPHDMDTRKFVRAATAEDPFTSEQFVSTLEEQDVPVFARPRRAGSIDSITSGTSAWWEILVPEEFLEKATALIEEERKRIDASADENAAAAEAEVEASKKETA
jgi:hypothetical protein